MAWDTIEDQHSPEFRPYKEATPSPVSTLTKGNPAVSERP